MFAERLLEGRGELFAAPLAQPFPGSLWRPVSRVVAEKLGGSFPEPVSETFIGPLNRPFAGMAAGVR